MTNLTIRPAASSAAVADPPITAGDAVPPTPPVPPAPRASATPPVPPAADPVVYDPTAASWSEIAERHYDHVYRVAYRLTGNRADAEDLAQETFCRVFLHVDAYRPGGSFEAWLARIATNLFLDAKRREARVRMEELLHDDNLVEDPGGGPERLVEAVTANAEIARALETLSPQLRQALVMCDVEGRSYQEIADQLGVALGTIRSRLHRARAQARVAVGALTAP